MMKDGDEKTEKTGKINGVKDADGKNEMQGIKEKLGVNNGEEEVVFKRLCREKFRGDKVV